VRLVRPPLDWALLLALSLLWGGAFMFQALAVASVGPATATAIRLVLAALALCAMLRLGLRRLPRDRRFWAWLAAIALLGNVLPFALTTWAQERVDSNLAGVLTASAPLVAVTLAHFFMPGERLTARRLLGVALGFAGVGVLLGPGAQLAGSELTAVAAVLAAAACYGATAVVAARMPDLPALPAAAGVLLIAAALATPAAFAFERPMRQAAIDATGVAALLALGLGVTAIGTWAYFKLARRAGPTFLSLFNYLNPLVAVAFGWLFLDEALAAGALPALMLIVAGLLLTS
jgi:drug/metabolite transporter (DMT)-like permease